MVSTYVDIRSSADLPGKLSADDTTYIFPEIINKGASGKDMYWRIYVRIIPPEREGKETEADFIQFNKCMLANERLVEQLVAVIKVDAGYVGKKLRVSAPTYVRVGLNIGKKNETNVVFQALRDAFGMFNKKLKKSTENQVGELQNMIFPMLAVDFEDGDWKDGMPAWLQYKFNGVRAVATLNKDGTVILYSRTKNIYPTFSEIKGEVKRLFERSPVPIMFDGEIYKHGVPLQDISGKARRKKEEWAIKGELEYHIFDCILLNNRNALFSERLAVLQKIFDGFVSGCVFLVGTREVKTRAEVDAAMKEAVEKEGYEGVIIRLDYPYKEALNNGRSRGLIKLKPVYDAEFKVVGWSTGEKGKAAKSIMIICETESGKQFTVTPALEIAERENLAAMMGRLVDGKKDGETLFERDWLGEYIKIYFDEYSKDRVPVRARTKLERLRDIQT